MGGGLLLGEMGAGRRGWGLKCNIFSSWPPEELLWAATTSKNICQLTASSRLVKQQRDWIYLGFVESLRTPWRLLSRIQQLQHLHLVLFRLSIFLHIVHTCPKPLLERNSFSMIHTCLSSFPPYILGFPSPTPCIGLLSAEFRGGLSLETGAGKGCLKPLTFSTQSAQQVFLDVFSLKKVWRSDAEDGESRAVKEGKERDEIPVICLLQPSPSGWGRKQPSAAEKTVLRFIALADSQKKSPKKWWGRLQEQTMVWQTDPPAKHQTGQERGKGLKHWAPFWYTSFPYRQAKYELNAGGTVTQL